jgi:hypothetical protein
LSDQAWQRTASVSVPPAKVVEYTAHYYGDWLAGHERAHLKRLPSHVAQVLGQSSQRNKARLGSAHE